MPTFLCELFKSAREVGGWSNNSEIQPVGAANIPVRYRTEMKRGHKARRWTLDLKRLESFVNRFFCPSTCPCRIAKGIDGKNCENRIADELEYIATMRLDTDDNGLEEVVEQCEKLFLVD